MDEILGSDVGKEYMRMEEFLREKNKNFKNKESNRPESEKITNKPEDISLVSNQDLNMNSLNLNGLSSKELNINTQSLNNENFERFSLAFKKKSYSSKRIMKNNEIPKNIKNFEK